MRKREKVGAVTYFPVSGSPTRTVQNQILSINMMQKPPIYLWNRKSYFKLFSIDMMELGDMLEILVISIREDSGFFSFLNSFSLAKKICFMVLCLLSGPCCRCSCCWSFERSNKDLSKDRSGTRLNQQLNVGPGQISAMTRAVFICWREPPY
jgi:hypothetical protein